MSDRVSMSSPEKILVRLGRGAEVGMEFPPLSFAAVDLATLPAGSFVQDAPHGRRRSREEMTAADPVAGDAIAETDHQILGEVGVSLGIWIL
jgi:hypothetical protein